MYTEYIYNQAYDPLNERIPERQRKTVHSKLIARSVSSKNLKSIDNITIDEVLTDTKEKYLNG
jgi:hypothetical protein